MFQSNRRARTAAIRAEDPLAAVPYDSESSESEGESAVKSGARAVFWAEGQNGREHP